MARRKPEKSKQKRRNPVSPSQDRKRHSLLRSLAMARQATDPRNALVLYEEALNAAKESFASRILKGDPVKPEENTETQAYLEALFGAGRSLQRLDQPEEAAQRFDELLERDAGDSQFARYWLARCLLDLNRQDELKVLLERFNDLSGAWLYIQALLAFRLEGDSEAAQTCLQSAYGSLPGFTDYLFGEQVVYAERPICFDGPLDEVTHSYAQLFLPAWRSTPGAATWARQVLRIPIHQWSTERKMDFPKQRLRRLPQRAVTWQLGLKRLDSESPREWPIWIVAVANIDDQKMLVMSVVEEEPVPEVVWERVLNALQHPMEGEPHRPEELVVPREDLLTAWDPPPRVGYGETKPELLEVLEALIATETRPWVEELYWEKFEHRIGRGYGYQNYWRFLEQEEWDRHLAILEQLPNDSPILVDQREFWIMLLSNDSADSPLTNPQKDRLRELLGEEKEEQSGEKSPTEEEQVEGSPSDESSAPGEHAP